MKETEVKLGEEGFEEVRTENKPVGESTSGGSNRPDMRVVQADRDRDGNVVYNNVGGMWRNISKNGNEFYTLRIGQLKLLVFPNDRK